MNKNRVIGIVIWILGLILSMVFMFGLEQGMTPTFWVTFGFIIVAFVSTLIFQLLVWKSNDTIDNQFIHTPALLVSVGYIIMQIPLSIVFSVGSSFIPVKVTILLNAIILIIAWIIILGSVEGNDHIRKVNGRQKNHHTEL